MALHTIPTIMKATDLIDIFTDRKIRESEGEFDTSDSIKNLFTQDQIVKFSEFAGRPLLISYFKNNAVLSHINPDWKFYMLSHRSQWSLPSLNISSFSRIKKFIETCKKISSKVIFEVNSPSFKGARLKSTTTVYDAGNFKIVTIEFSGPSESGEAITTISYS